MKAVILAGGFGTRLAEETQIKPKPMVEIGGKPILWHLLKLYSFYGVQEFIICCGYKGYFIKEYFDNYALHLSDVTYHMNEGGRMEVHNQTTEPWKVTLIDTGDESDTGGRLLRVKDYIKEDTFCFTYGDGLADININSLISFHSQNNCIATLTAVRPPGRYGALRLDGSKVLGFQEKPLGDGAWINGGFFVLNQNVFEFIKNDYSCWEVDVLPVLANLGKLNAFSHKGYWHPMDTLRDKRILNELWLSKKAPWKVW